MTGPWALRLGGGGGLEPRGPHGVGAYVSNVDKRDLYIAPIASIFILNCSKIVGVWGSAPDPTGKTYSAPTYPYSCFNLGSRIDGANEVYLFGGTEQLNPSSKSKLRF